MNNQLEKLLKWSEQLVEEANLFLDLIKKSPECFQPCAEKFWIGKKQHAESFNKAILESIEEYKKSII